MHPLFEDTRTDSNSARPNPGRGGQLALKRRENSGGTQPGTLVVGSSGSTLAKLLNQSHRKQRVSSGPEVSQGAANIKWAQLPCISSW